ncbi:hypothetical protein NT6N_31650 [Oceaniferula spumae]|uniref:Uncharacterized protein n=1 Tax=Oceaniferula spumae TaxID=2979115 RepID=A0AAT9FQ19_9BACT
MTRGNTVKINQVDTSGDSVSKSGSWREDLLASRDLNDREKQGFGFLLSWFETWRVSRRLPADVKSARQFWKSEVIVKDRKQWQLEQWAESIRWYLRWLDRCARDGR